MNRGVKVGPDGSALSVPAVLCLLAGTEIVAANESVDDLGALSAVELDAIGVEEASINFRSSSTAALTVGQRISASLSRHRANQASKS
jgi:hypothetical protein